MTQSEIFIARSKRTVLTWPRVRTPFEPRGRPSQKHEGGGRRGKKGLRNKKRLRSSKLRGRAPATRETEGKGDALLVQHGVNAPCWSS